MKRLFFSLFVSVLVGLVLSLGGVAEATILNGGFETGDLSNWTVFTAPGGIPPGNAQVVSTHTPPYPDPNSPLVYNPIEGNYFALLESGGPGSYTTLSQTFSISSGLQIEGWAAFDAGDYLSGDNSLHYDDSATVNILNANGTFFVDLWSADVTTVLDYGDGLWTYWSWTAPTSGDYILELGIINGGTPLGSYALLDAVKVVPEPATMLLLGSGLLGLAAFGRKKKKRI